MQRSLTALAAAVLLLPASALAAPRTFAEAVYVVVEIIDVGTGLVILGGIVVYFWGISTNILKMKDEGGAVFKAYFLWGIIALFVMFSVWGIIELLQNTLFGGGSFSPTDGGAGNPLGGNGSPQFPVFGE